MKKSVYLYTVFTLVVLSCSQEQLDTSKIIATIDAAKNYKITKAEGNCGEIEYKYEGDKIRKIYADTYMGDGGDKITCYFWDDELIYCHIYSYYDGPMQKEDGTFTMGGEAVGSKYKLYYANGKLAKYLKDDVVFTDIDSDQAPNPDKLYKNSKKIVESPENVKTEIICDGIFF